MKRIAIYNFYNRNGIVEKYVDYFLAAMREFCEYICVVVNGNLSSEGQKDLNKHADLLITRENRGFDSWAHKTAIEKIGYTKLNQYDELIICNSTFYGPIFPMNDMFATMESRHTDFWGISRYPKNELEDIVNPQIKYQIPSHIQSYFIAFTNKVINSSAFKEFWDTLKPVHNYDEARSFFEWRLTDFLEGKGFTSSVYMDFNKYGEYKENSTILFSAKQLIEDKNPFVKIKVFDYGTANWLREAIGHDARDIIEFIENKTEYPIDYIYEDLIHNHKMSSLRSELHLDFSLPTDRRVLEKQPVRSKCAVILFVYYEDLIDETLRYLRNFPEYFDFFITSSKSQLLDSYKNKLKIPNKAYFLSCENRGRDVSAYLVSAIDVFRKYEIVCCLHDKKSKQLNSLKASEEYSYQCFENLAASRHYIENIVDLFERDKHLGMLVPPPVDFAMFSCVGFELGMNTEGCHDLYKELKLTAPFDDAPVAPYGTMFWTRGSTFDLLTEKKLSYSDFPPEPNGIDGTLLHAYERLYPLIVQNAGFYVGWVMTDNYCHTYMDNLYEKIRYFNWYLGSLKVYTWRNQQSYILSKIFCQNFNTNLSDYLTDAERRIIRRGLKFHLAKYRLLSHLTFGRLHSKYKTKKKITRKILNRLG